MKGLSDSKRSEPMQRTLVFAAHVFRQCPSEPLTSSCNLLHQPKLRTISTIPFVTLKENRIQCQQLFKRTKFGPFAKGGGSLPLTSAFEVSSEGVNLLNTSSSSSYPSPPSSAGFSGTYSISTFSKSCKKWKASRSALKLEQGLTDSSSKSLDFVQILLERN